MLRLTAGRKIPAHPKEVAAFTFLLDVAAGVFDDDPAVVSLGNHD